jgi:hypothetical protein
MTSLPQSEWCCRELRDAKATELLGVGACKFCGTRIRWVHVLEHEACEQQMIAGCCCAARLCRDYDARGAEREEMNRLERLARFADPRRWTRSRSNPDNAWRFIRTVDRKKWRATVFVVRGSYSACLAHVRDGRRHFHPASCASQEGAVKLAFELVERLRRGG